MHAAKRPGRRPGRAPEHEDRRESILDAALHSFAERGFYGTAIPEIATRAEIAAGTLYHYFDSKEALVNALYRKWKAAVAQRVFAAFPTGAPPREQFRVIWNEMVTFALAETTAFAFLELHNHASYLDAESIAVDRNVKDFTRTMLERAQAAGAVVVMNPVLQMELVFGAFNGMMRAHWERRITLDDQALQNAEQASWDAIAAR